MLDRIETGKWWTIGGSLRGFYDDNWNYAPDNSPSKKSSWGVEIVPNVGANWLMEQGFLKASYRNSSRFYEARTGQDQKPWDFDHDFSLTFNHAISPRYQLTVKDDFSYGVLPYVTAGVATAPDVRGTSTRLVNQGNVGFTGEITPELGFSAAYKNTYVNYYDAGVNSYAASLDRVEHSIPIDLRWQVSPSVVALVGYMYGRVDYTGNGTLLGGSPSSSRDLQSHAVYLGTDVDFTKEVRGSLRVGGQYAVYQDFGSLNQWTPYVDASVTLKYFPSWPVQVGFKHQLASTDVTSRQLGGTTPTLNVEASSVYLQASHQFTAKVSANLLVQYQWSSFYSGGYDGLNEDLLMLNAYGAYKLDQFWSLEGGYIFDWRTSPGDLGVSRTFHRNMVYFGVHAQF
ncbi:MAG: outer membrane beta-barrel protein [Verrucomicrobia bacterium]|nr:outer membrane beta-barrel protein [Verrucomicrobiota bacterium]